MTKQQDDDLETELLAARKKISEQEEEIAERLWSLRRSGTIHKEILTGNPWSPRICLYFKAAEVVLKLAGAINVDVNTEDSEISHKLNRKEVKPIIVKFQNHKVKSRL